MKSFIKITALIVASAFISVSSSYANQIQVVGKPLNHDSSVATKNECNNIVERAMLIQFNFDEEEFIDDITINTEFISANLLYKKAMAVEFSFEDEEYIDDISL